MKTNIINLYGGPGIGKSTTAAYLFYLLKKEHLNVELVREYVKGLIYQNKSIDTYEQLYVLSKQIKHETMLYGKVNWIITDAPILMNGYYSKNYYPNILGKSLYDVSVAFYRQTLEEGHKHFNILLKRSAAYIQSGRYQNEDEAKKVDEGVKNMLSNLEIDFVEADTTESDLLLTWEKLKTSYF
jgi:hypothetical protein